MSCVNHAKWALTTALILVACSISNLYLVNIADFAIITPILIIISPIIAYIPDADSKTSKARKMINYFLKIFSLAVVLPSLSLMLIAPTNILVRTYSLVPLIIVIIIQLILANLKHRFALHSLVVNNFLLFTTILILLILGKLNNINLSIIVASYLGIIIHIMTDLPTSQGVALLWPIYKKKIKLPIRITDKEVEDLITKLYVLGGTTAAVIIAAMELLSIILR